MTPAQIATLPLYDRSAVVEAVGGASPFDEGVLESDAQRISAVYRDQGYYQARASYTLEWDATHDAVRIRITGRLLTPPS